MPAVVWPFTRHDKDGQPRVANTPFEVNTHWDQAQVELIGDDATPVAINVTAMIDRDVTKGSLIWLGELEDVPENNKPVPLMEIVSFEKIPDVKGRKFQRTVMLRRFKGNGLPL